MANILEDDRYYSKYDKEKWVWVQVDPNEPRDIKSKYMETNQGIGFDPTKDMISAVFKLVDRLEYEAINNPLKLEQLKNENPKAWVNIVAKNMNLIQSSQEVEYFFDEAFRSGVQWFKTSEYKKLNTEIKNDKNLIKALSNKGLHFISFADKETQKQLVLENEKFLKHVSGNYVEEFTEAIKLQNSQQISQDKKVEKSEEIVKEDVNLNEDWNDYDFVMKKVQEDGRNIYDASIELKKNKNIVIEAVKQCPDVVYSDTDLNIYLKDIEVMLEVVKKDGYMLRFASEELRNNEDIVVEAVKASKGAIKYVSNKIKDNEEIMIKLMQEDRLGLVIREA